ncbi:sensor histidine kinase [Melaminivora suipulveris]|uniref:sensor histidine kinase n=1 Tax=Melaminivora suipulveris TaxID=2109913 RepID=UPI00131A4A68|nr:ATP-binding protein [Melaminivora suipulveris]
MRRGAALVLACLGLLLLAGAPLWPRLATFEGGQRLVHALVAPAGEGVAMPWQPVQLPHTWPPHLGDAERRYRLQFELSEAPREALYLFLPLLSQSAVVALNGAELADTGNRSLPTGITSGVTALVRLPADRLLPGTNTLDVRVAAAGVVRGHLAPPHLGSAEALTPHYRLQLFLLEHLRLMVLAGQLLLVVALLVVWLYRPAEPLFGWLLLMQALSLPLYAGLRADLPGVQEALPYLLMVSTASTFILPIIALLVSGMPVPRALRACVPAVPALGIALALLAPLPARQVMLAFSVPAALAAVWAAVLVAAMGALRGVREAQLLLAPLLLFALALLHDVALVAGWLDGAILLGAYYRLVLMIVIAVLLMRRMGLSLMRLDGANARLRERLAEREAQLARLHAEERREAAERVRSQERQRLTVDLHDGVSGHLASIIALAEREGAPAIERSAREALDDLRAVIHSLDIGDRELAVALAGLRERSARQLKRLGVELDWSTARLPEISGVTPTHALNVLRIVQEALTNAVRHGPATRIAVRGEAHGAAQAAIVVENDGAPFTAGGGGAGLENMRRRARLLGGAMRFEALPRGGARAVLVLPLQLPGQELLPDR